MRVTLYGTHLCPDCVDARKALAENGIPCAFVELTESTANIKAFLRYRDDPAYADTFDTVRANHGIGIPCFVFEDGTLTLDTQRAIALSKQ